ncbi:PREDICTED: ATP synthase [Prunus dulcis]|uniref:PREDICTED: ATP synthase n=1 Tax=Prunus dulcis TaxID=3755 RepID=A0A5E4GDF6_PRUDU|nr:PREDICTED: ATP synthase [Prunus dulcis]
MAKTRPERKDVDSYTIRGNNKGNVLKKWWFCSGGLGADGPIGHRPEESIRGRRKFHEGKVDAGELAPDIVAVEMLGELVDNLGPVDTRATSPIHRSVPAFIQPQSQNAFSASPEADAKLMEDLCLLAKEQVLPLPFLEANLTFTEDFQDLAGQWAAIEKNYKEAEVYKNTFSTSVRDLEQERKACSLKYQQLQQVKTEIVARLQKQDFVKAIDDFHEKHCIGKGGFGRVYKAELLSGQGGGWVLGLREKKREEQSGVVVATGKR